MPVTKTILFDAVRGKKSFLTNNNDDGHCCIKKNIFVLS